MASRQGPAQVDDASSDHTRCPLPVMRDPAPVGGYGTAHVAWDSGSPYFAASAWASITMMPLGPRT